MASGGSNRLLTSQQVAELLGVSRKTVYRHAGSSWQLPVRKLGRAVRYSERDIQNFIERLH